jgi:hypothetical protein
VPNTSNLIYVINEVEILEDWTTTLSLKKKTPPELQVPRIYPLNLGQLIRHPTLSYLLYVYVTAHIIAKDVIAKTETRAIKTSPPQRLTLHPSPARTV